MTKQGIITASAACLIGSIFFSDNCISSAFTCNLVSHTRGNSGSLSMRLNPFEGKDGDDRPHPLASAVMTAVLAATLTLNSLASPVLADTPASAAQKYDGFAEYAKGMFS